MKKKKWMALVMMMVLVVCAACNHSEASESAIIGAAEMSIMEERVDSQPAGAPAEGMAVEYMYMQPEDDTVQELIVYHSNDRADGLETERMEAQELTAGALIDALATHNVASIDTKVLAFECVEAQGNRTLKLDLSEAFGEYLKTMGKSGEDVVIAALTNTFLENYHADGLWLTVDGQILETEHAIYGEALTFRDVEQAR